MEQLARKTRFEDLLEKEWRFPGVNGINPTSIFRHIVAKRPGSIIKIDDFYGASGAYKVMNPIKQSIDVGGLIASSPLVPLSRFQDGYLEGLMRAFSVAGEVKDCVMFAPLQNGMVAVIVDPVFLDRLNSLMQPQFVLPPFENVIQTENVYTLDQLNAQLAAVWGVYPHKQYPETVFYQFDGPIERNESYDSYQFVSYLIEVAEGEVMPEPLLKLQCENLWHYNTPTNVSTFPTREDLTARFSTTIYQAIIDVFDMLGLTACFEAYPHLDIDRRQMAIKVYSIATEQALLR